MYPSGKEKILVTRDQKHKRDINRLGLIGISYLEARIASLIPSRGVIGEVQCGFLWIYTPTPYSAVFLLHAPTPAPIKIDFGAVRCRCGLAVWVGLIWVGLGQSKCQFESEKSTFTTTQKFG